jgi:hypothetical protein
MDFSNWLLEILHEIEYLVFSQLCLFWGKKPTTEVSKDTLITKNDLTGKREFRELLGFFPQKRHNCEKTKYSISCKISSSQFEKSILHPM